MSGASEIGSSGLARDKAGQSRTKHSKAGRTDRPSGHARNSNTDAYLRCTCSRPCTPRACTRRTDASRRARCRRSRCLGLRARRSARCFRNSDWLSVQAGPSSCHRGLYTSLRAAAQTSDSTVRRIRSRSMCTRNTRWGRARQRRIAPPMKLSDLLDLLPHIGDGASSSSEAQFGTLWNACRRHTAGTCWRS
jgi:hypothetical protein